MVPLPGSAMPSASQRQFIELAVNMPEQDPHVGQALCSSFFRSSAVILPACSSPTPLNTEIRSDFCAAGWRCAGRSPSAACWATPAAIGPPLTKTVGMFRRMEAMSMPGTILSQFGMQTMPSKQCAGPWTRRSRRSTRARAANTSCRRGPWRCRHPCRWC